MNTQIVEVDVPGIQGPSGPVGVGEDLSSVRGGIVPPNYNEGTTYAVGSFVSQSGLEYMCEAIPVVGAFDSQYWVVASTKSNTARITTLEDRILALEAS